MGKSSLQREMDKFLKDASDSEFAIRSITKSAFSQSRKQLKPEAFLELNDIICRDFYSQVRYLGYQEHRVLSIDGTRLLLPNSADIAEEFGTAGYGPNADAQRSLATTSFLYDVGNYLTVDAQVADKNGSEQSLVFKHLDKTSAGDLLLMDRGYPSKAIFSILLSKGVHFCVRMKENWWLQVKAFFESGKMETDVVFELSNKDMETYQSAYPGMQKSVTCRLVKVILDNGTTEILCTSLLNKEKYPLEDFKEIYHLRWGGEEGFKMYKSRVQIEAFTGKTAVSVKQDIFAKAMMMSLCAAFAFPIEQKVKQEYETASENKHPQKINRTNAYYIELNVTEFSEFWISGSIHIEALPVQMVFIEAEAMNNDSIQVRWATASEVNNREFDVERSTDGNTWTMIGVVAGHGNSNQQNNYNFNDLNVVPGIHYYYRLKQIDNNGQYQYTDIVQAMLTGQGTFMVMNFVPNPTVGNTQLSVVTTKEQEISVDFYDMLGQRVYSSVEELFAGNNKINFDLRRLAAGTYSAVVTSDNQLYTKKIVITK